MSSKVIEWSMVNVLPCFWMRAYRLERSLYVSVRDPISANNVCSESTITVVNCEDSCKTRYEVDETKALQQASRRTFFCY